ncbi:MAG: SDR family oxidoreductase [Gemmatimonadetes bacterium]|nr:SDR family oxidoreductase [Gemmatimonadota bacterium]MDA1103212.1 SDR family oxidoreductase [Gemmatimonadota bacterium]
MTENRLLSGRVAIVTGASAGIGAATARTLALAGASVVLTARRLDRLEALTVEIEEAGGRALPLRADVVSLSDTREVVRRTLDEFGRIDVLVNNAGIMPVAPLADVRIEEWTSMIDVNIKGVLHFVSAVLPHMIEQHSGHIVNVGSVAGRRPFPGGSVYAATKFAVRALSWGLHLELGSAHGIRVTDIQPGFVSTELLDGDPETAAAWSEAWKGRRTLQPEDVARAIEFAVTSPDHVSVSEILVRPTDQPT